MKLVVLDSYTAVSTDLSLSPITSLCSSADVYDRTPTGEIAKRIGDAEIVIINKTPLGKEVLSSCPNLKYIGIFATGYNVVDIEYCRQRGIVVANVPGYSTNAVAQLVFAFILEKYSMVSEHNAEVKGGRWQNCSDFAFYSPMLSELAEKTIGIVGFGNIGKKVAELAVAFGMEVLFNSRSEKKQCETSHIKQVPLEELLQKSDIVTLHCPLTPETNRLINSERLALMKDGAMLINTARGDIVDEQACADALNSGKLSAMAVDVVSKEPIEKDNPLLKAKNCIITPHMAWACHETRERLIEAVRDNLAAFLKGEPINNVAK